MLPVASAPTAIVRHEDKPVTRRLVMSDSYIITVIAGEVVSVPRRSVTVHANGNFTVPVPE